MHAGCRIQSAVVILLNISESSLRSGLMFPDTEFCSSMNISDSEIKDNSLNSASAFIIS